MYELWVITYCTSCKLRVIFLPTFVTDIIFVYNFAALLKNDNQEVILILETLLFVSDWKNDIFQNSSLESDKFLILLLIFLLLKIVQKKSITGALNSFQYLAEPSVVCLIHAKLFSSKKEKEQVV